MDNKQQFESQANLPKAFIPTFMDSPEKLNVQEKNRTKLYIDNPLDNT